MKKRVLKDLIELQNEEIRHLKEALENSHKEHVSAVNMMNGYHNDVKRVSKEMVEWRTKWEEAMKDLEEQQRKYEHLKQNYNFFKEKNDNLLIANGKLVKENKELRGN